MTIKRGIEQLSRNLNENQKTLKNERLKLNIPQRLGKLNESMNSLGGSPPLEKGLRVKRIGLQCMFIAQFFKVSSLKKEGLNKCRKQDRKKF